MTQAHPTYVEQTDQGGYRVSGTRVSLDSVVYAYWDGRSPEAISSGFPTLTPAQVYGAIAFYLTNRAEVDAYLAAQKDRWEALRQESETRNADFIATLRTRAAGTISDAS